MILQGDAIARLSELPADSIHCCVTSPPYWGLRDYGVEGQIGLESTPAEYITRMVAVFEEVRRVLRPDAVCFVNIGDSYARAGGIGGGNRELLHMEGKQKRQCKLIPGQKEKDLCLIPWRLAIALQDAGWWVRDIIVWDKPAPMPESVRDRCTKSWEPILMLTKSAKYYWDAGAIAEPAIEGKDLGLLRGKSFADGVNIAAHAPSIVKRQIAGVDSKTAGNGTRNKRNVWRLAPMPLSDAHFATFPLELPETCILAACPPDGTVLDPFCGTATTGLAALKHGRKFIGIELNAEYIRIAERRLVRHYPLLSAAQ